MYVVMIVGKRPVVTYVSESLEEVDAEVYRLHSIVYAILAIESNYAKLLAMLRARWRAQGFHDKKQQENRRDRLIYRMEDEISSLLRRSNLRDVSRDMMNIDNIRSVSFMPGEVVPSYDVTDWVADESIYTSKH